MPPLQPPFAPEAAQLISSIRRREKDITDVLIPRLRACPGPLSLQQKLSAELREDMDVFARQIEDLDAMIDDQKGPKHRRELKVSAEELKQTLAKLRKEYRAAVLLSKRTIDTSTASNRAELLTATVVRDTRDVNEKASEDAVMQANQNVTEALERSLSLMHAELERSVLTTQMLDSSMSTLRATSSTHDLLSNALDTSKQLITALQKSDRMDRFLIFFGLILFFLSVSIVLKERLIDRSVRMAFWWTRFLPSGSVTKLGSSAASEASASLSETIITASSALGIASGMSLFSTGVSIAPSTLSPVPEFMEGSVLTSLSAIVASTQELSSAETVPIPEPTSHLDDFEGSASEMFATAVDAHDEL